MKALVIALCLVPFAAHADCADASWSVTPAAGTTLPSNGRITLEGYGGAQKFISTMASRNPRLVAGEIVIPLTVVETHVGEFLVTQVVLKAKGALPEGTKLRLRFDHPDDVHFRLPRDEAPEWTITRADFTPPVWSGPPVIKPGRYAEFGCGPVIEAIVAVPVTGALQMRARLSGPKPREYLLDVENGHVIVGHSMCSGPFRISGDWTLELTALDAAGNALAAPGEPLRFNGHDAAR